MRSLTLLMIPLRFFTPEPFLPITDQEAKKYRWKR